MKYGSNKIKKTNFIDLECDSQEDKKQTKDKSQVKFLLNYDNLLNFPYQRTNSLSTYESILFNFVQNAKKNVLFIFGPSGCGKKIMTKNFLRSNGIIFEVKEQYYQYNENRDQGRWIPLIQVIIKTLQTTNYVFNISIFQDFPTIEYGLTQNSDIKNFRVNIKTYLQNTNQKIIFILNNEIYNSFYILNERSINCRVDVLPNIEVIKMQSYGKKDIIFILEQFMKIDNTYNKIIQYVDEIVELSNGDVRKALHSLLLIKMQQNIGKSYNYNCSSTQLLDNKYKIEPCHKLSIFHMLGKMLYGKRLDLDSNNKKNKKELSKYYSQQELIRRDPPFYFNPITMYNSYGPPMPIFVDILQQNYIDRYGTITDCSNINEIFCLYDSIFTYTMKFDDNQAINQLNVELLTWGILLYNKNSILLKGQKHGLQTIHRSRNNLIKYQCVKKWQLIHKYFPQNRKNDVIKYAHIKKSLFPNTILSDPLLQIIFDNYHRKIYSINDDASKMKNLQEKQREQEQIQTHHKYKQAIKVLQKKKRMQQMIKLTLLEEQDSDIDIMFMEISENQQIIDWQEQQNEYSIYKPVKIKDLFPLNYQQAKKQFFNHEQMQNPHFIYRQIVSPQIISLHTEYQQLAYKILINNVFKPPNIAKLQKKQVLTIINSYLDNLGLKDYVEIKFMDLYLSRTSVAFFKNKIILKIRTPLDYNIINLEGVLHHQIGTHVIRSLNHRENCVRKPSQKGKVIQEGLAAINQLLPEKRPILFKAALRYMAAIYASKMDFVGLYKKLSKYVSDSEDCWRECVRVKRGISNTQQKGGYYKDQHYLIGAAEILSNRSNIDFEKIYYGKLNPDQTKHLESGVLPPFLDTQEKLKNYLKSLDRIALCNFIDENNNNN